MQTSLKLEQPGFHDSEAWVPLRFRRPSFLAHMRDETRRAALELAIVALLVVLLYFA